MQTFRISKVRISQKVEGVIMCNLRGTIFYMKPNVLQGFHICISVPLIFHDSSSTDQNIAHFTCLSYLSFIFVIEITF